VENVIDHMTNIFSHTKVLKLQICAENVIDHMTDISSHIKVLKVQIL